MGILDSLNPPPTSEYIRRWADAMEREQYDSALSVLEEGLQTATKENNSKGLLITQTSKNLLTAW